MEDLIRKLKKARKLDLKEKFVKFKKILNTSGNLLGCNLLDENFKPGILAILCPFMISFYIICAIHTARFLYPNYGMLVKVFFAFGGAIHVANVTFFF